MKKEELVKQIDFKATSIFVSASVGLAVASALTYIISAVSSINEIVQMIFQILSVAFMIFAYVMTVKGFSTVNRSCKLSEANEHYYFGRNMMIFSVLSIVLSIIFEIVLFMLYMMLSVYKNAESMTEQEVAAAGNLKVITAVIVIVVQLVSVSMPYIFYMWRIHKSTPKTNSINNFALLTMFVMIVKIAIGVLNAIYSIKGGDTSFLSGFAEILNVIQYLFLTVFFAVRRKSLIPVNELKIEE